MNSIRIALAAVFAAGAASAAPTQVTLTPPQGARFLAGQRFDIRVEGKGTGPFSATLKIDGRLQPFTSGARNTVGTDGITSDGWGGFNVRGFSTEKPGSHTVTASFSDATGTVAVETRFQVLPPRGEDGQDAGGRVKNIVIMLGDGMGAAHRTAARLVKHGATNGDPNGFLAMDGFPGTGLVTTHSLNSIVTDSAPGMACYTTGNHSANGQEGVYPAQMKNPFNFPRVEYMAEYLHRVKGTSTGIVSTADLEDATPAANAVHTGNRGAGTGIVDQYLDESDRTGLAVLLGGGRRWFLPGGKSGDPFSSRAASSDYGPLPQDVVSGWQLSSAGAIDEGRNLIQDFEAASFTYVDSATSLHSRLVGSPTKLLGLFGYGNMNVAIDKIAKRRGAPLPPGRTYVVDDYHAPDQPMLDEMTEAALQVLSKNRRGFFLMVEGAHIDKQSHLMDAERAVGEVIEFDHAVAVARRWADRLGNTIVIVVADHECSGFSIVGALQGGVANLRSLPSDANNLAPDLRKQPERLKAVGTYDAARFPRYNILQDGYPETFDVDGKILFGFGANGDRYETWLMRPVPVIDSLLPSNIKTELGKSGYAGEPLNRASDQQGYFVRGQAPGDQAVHTASDIPISAYSSGSQTWRSFVGVQRNTDVFFKLMRAALGKEQE